MRRRGRKESRKRKKKKRKKDREEARKKKRRRKEQKQQVGKAKHNGYSDIARLNLIQSVQEVTSTLGTRGRATGGRASPLRTEYCNRHHLLARTRADVMNGMPLLCTGRINPRNTERGGLITLP